MKAKAQHFIVILLLNLTIVPGVKAQTIKQPIPDHLIFDDGVSTHAEFVAPMLKKYGFGGIFFVCEFPLDFADKYKYMTWKQIAHLSDMGFEIGNHIHTHMNVTEMNK